jgi:hypothetical protein
VLTSIGLILPSSRPARLLSPPMRRTSRPKSTAAPSSLLRLLLSVLGRMKAPLSPSARTGSRLVSVRESRPLLLRPGRSQLASVGVSDDRGDQRRSRSTPTGTEQELPLGVASLPIGVESG